MNTPTYSATSSGISGRFAEVWYQYKILNPGGRQFEMAGMLGLHKTAFNNYLSGNRQPPTKIVLKFCEIIDCEPGVVDPDLGNILILKKSRPKQSEYLKLAASLSEGECEYLTNARRASE